MVSKLILLFGFFVVILIILSYNISAVCPASCPLQQGCVDTGGYPTGVCTRCYNSDGLSSGGYNINVAGSVTIFATIPAIFYDTCLSNGNVQEYNCNSGPNPTTFTQSSLPCGQGRVCSNGACIDVSCIPSCSGRTCGNDGCGGSCGSCSAGQTCQDGICLTEGGGDGGTPTTTTCFDSDNANNPYVYGYVQLDNQQLYDTCVNSFSVQERYCTAVGLGDTILPCEGTDVCSEGKCICNPTFEDCDGIDNDCDGIIDDGNNLCSGNAECFDNGVCREPVVCNFNEDEPNPIDSPNIFETAGCDIISINADSPNNDVDLFQLRNYSIGRNKEYFFNMIYPPGTDNSNDKVFCAFDGNRDLLRAEEDRDYDGGGFLPAEINIPSPYYSYLRNSSKFLLFRDSYYQSGGDVSYDIQIPLSVNINRWPAPLQKVYLNYEGGENVVIGSRTPVDIGPFDIGSICAQFEGNNELAMALITARVREHYSGYRDIEIISSRESPHPIGPYTRIHIGNVYDAGLLGIGDYIDEFNEEDIQHAIVYGESFGVGGFCVFSLESVTNAIANTASHEAGHLLGLQHTSDIVDIMDITAPPSQMTLPQRFKMAELHQEVCAEEDFYQLSRHYLEGILGKLKTVGCFSIFYDITTDDNPSQQSVYSSGAQACQTSGLACYGIEVSCHNVDGDSPLWLVSKTSCGDTYPFAEGTGYEDCVFRAVCANPSTCSGASNRGGGSGGGGSGGGKPVGTVPFEPAH